MVMLEPDQFTKFQPNYHPAMVYAYMKPMELQMLQMDHASAPIGAFKAVGDSFRANPVTSSPAHTLTAGILADAPLG